jgi:hypothetical protein
VDESMDGTPRQRTWDYSVDGFRHVAKVRGREFESRHPLAGKAWSDSLFGKFDQAFCVLLSTEH